MKINWFLFGIAFAITGLCTYGFFTTHIESRYLLVMTIGSFISLFMPLSGMLAMSLNVRGSINVRVVSLLFFIGLLIDNIVFVGVFSLAPYIIITGILVLFYLCTVYVIIKAMQSAK